MTGITKDELMQMAREAGFDDYELERMLSTFANALLERAAVHFDDIGRYIDGSWSEGWYEPQEPGEIIRALKINTGD